MKQKCEGIVSGLLKQMQVWYLKLQVMPLAHQKMPADFIVLPHTINTRWLIECKQVTIKPEENQLKARFYFDRLGQEEALERFELSSENNRSFVCLYFYYKNAKNSDMYFITLDCYKRLKEECIAEDRKSMTLEFLTNKYENEDDFGMIRYVPKMEVETIENYLRCHSIRKITTVNVGWTGPGERKDI